MNKAAIKKELRRSAAEDVDPYYQCSFSALAVALEFSEWPGMARMSPDELSTFFLLVAEAL